MTRLAPDPAYFGVQNRVQTERDGRSSNRNQRRLCLCENGVQHESTQNRGPQPQDQHAAALAMTEVHEAVVQVAFVGSCHALAFDGSANDGEQRVENRHTQNEQRNKQRRQEKVGLTWGVGLALK